MSKLKEIIHQYVVEALQEILSEEVEQISELSDDLLYSYKRKARKAINKLNSPEPSNPDSPRAKQLEKRVKGYRLAWDKLGRK